MNRTRSCAWLAVWATSFACQGKATEPTDCTGSDTDCSEPADTALPGGTTLSEQNPLGSCVLRTPTGEVPSPLHQNSGVYPTGDFPPFSKALDVNGITLLGQAESSDAFMADVAAAIDELFDPTGAEIDPALQELVMTSMYQRKTLIPLIKGDDIPDWTTQQWQQFDQIAQGHSICDVIFELGGRGQTMEVVEHILHHVNMTGLHYALIDDWGITESSTLASEMQAAIDSGHYNIEDYSDLDGDPEKDRVLMQEYAYWVISTGWDIQTTYGGDGGSGEWTLQDPADFASAQPVMHQVFQDTIPRVMVPMSSATLAGFED